jgi:hypothetical protein
MSELTQDEIARALQRTGLPGVRILPSAKKQPGQKARLAEPADN